MCPPEDCGGPWGYADLLAAISGTEHEEHDGMLEWVG
jgi:Plasmid pRiA4b ORF-3-like protein